MTYAVGSAITAADINSQINSINAIWGTGSGNSGYGQSAIANVSAGQVIPAAKFEEMRSAMADMASHQNSSIAIPPATDLEVGDVVQAFTNPPKVYDIPAAISTLTSNKLNVNAAQTSIATIVNHQRTTAWSTQIKHVFTLNFTTNDNARKFFNLGGQIRFSASRSGGSASTQNTDWTNLLSAAGTTIYDHLSYYNNQTFDQTLASYTGSGAYVANDYTIKYRSNLAGGGSSIIMTVEFNDDHTSGFSDTVDGTIISTIQRRDIGAPLNSPFPSYTLNTALTAGS